MHAIAIHFVIEPLPRRAVVFHNPWLNGAMERSQTAVVDLLAGAEAPFPRRSRGIPERVVLISFQCRRPVETARFESASCPPRLARNARTCEITLAMERWSGARDRIPME
jgi:hypothetical protein